MIVLVSVSLAIWVYLILWHGRFWQSGPILSPRQPATEPYIGVVIPARDEAPLIGQTLRSLLAQDYAGTMRIVLVDDGSRDGTGDIARAIGDPRLTVLSGTARPAGWSGKLWAIRQGLAELADAPMILMTDADILHDPRHLSALVSQAEHRDYDLVSEMVELSCDSPAERALVPAFVFFFQLLYPFAWVNDPLRKTAAAAGGTILIRRRALTRIGGIEAVSGDLIDDVALATAVKRGGPIWLGHSRLARSVRPYPHVKDIWQMISRTAYVQLRFSPLLLAGTILGMIVTWLIPPIATIFFHGGARAIAVLTWILLAASYLPTLSRFRRWPLWALALPVIAAFYTAATIGSAINHYRGRGVAWKGRAYQGAGE
jgi:hopene-associated glycosyltransferase HpnB